MELSICRNEGDFMSESGRCNDAVWHVGHEGPEDLVEHAGDIKRQRKVIDWFAGSETAAHISDRTAWATFPFSTR